MHTEELESKEYSRRAVEATIRVGLMILLAVSCYLILRPFLTLITWGIIVAIAVYPGFRKLTRMLGGREKLAAGVCTALLIAVFIVPAVLLSQTTIQGVQSLVTGLRDGTLVIPPPPPSVGRWPLIGTRLQSFWNLASSNLTAAIQSLAPKIKDFLPGILSASAGIGLAMLELFLSLLVAGALLAYAPSGAKLSRSLAARLLADRGPEFEKLAASTIRSVTTGILGVALIQTIFAGIGFLVAGLPGAGLWAAIFLFAAVLQTGALVLVPAAIYYFTVASTTKAVVFLIWCVLAGLMDNVLKPLLLGRGVAVPIAVVFLGAIGGFIAMGIIGLFVGAIVLSVGYKLFLAWLDAPAPAGPQSSPE